MIIDSKSMDPPPPPYLPPPPPFSAVPARSTHKGPWANFSSLPAHILLQIVYSTFPQSDGRYDGESKLERQRENLHWMVTALRLVNRALYIASMHILRSTYIPAYDSLIRPPYTSNPFPSSVIASDSIIINEHREIATLDHFIALLAHEDLYLDATSLHLPREEAYKDLFDLAQPKSRLEDLIKEEGEKVGLIYAGDRPPPSPSPPTSMGDDGNRGAEANTSSSTASPPEPGASPPPPPSPKTSFNPFSKSSYLSLAKSKIRRSSTSKTPPSPLTPTSPFRDNHEDVPKIHKPTEPDPLPFALLSVSFSPRRVGLVYTITSSTASAFQGQDYGALSLSITGPRDGGRTLKKTLVEVTRPREEKLEVTARRVVILPMSTLDAPVHLLVLSLVLGSVLLLLRFRRPKQVDYFQLTGVPPPTPLPNFDINKAKPRPYRPFRWEYHQNMSLHKLEPDWWLELESTYRERIAQRRELHAQHGPIIINALPGSDLACRELMEMVIQFLCTRYPNQFSYSPQTGIFLNQILSTSTDTNKIDPLVFLNENIPEDFLITLEEPKTGLYCLRAGVCCSAVGWNLGIKIGKPLHEIHEPVPDYAEKMKFSMDRFFTKMPCDKPIQRGSWGLEDGQPLFAQEDSHELDAREKQRPDLKLEDVHLRVDWQTLRRLPKSRAIVFNFKALFTPLSDFRHEPYIPRLLLKVLKEGKPSILKYKGSWHTEHVAIPVLEQWAKEQEEKGLVPSDWKERTLDESPFFPGWNRDTEMWRQ
ncbi:hypothetical protein V5O48_004093 [Marasmius crinis-equi]|uniref:Uncharacterized protein n=1 Tax=Marasmius crinis-equi TaxID=585013 RepID=A0ABR3FR06_9AGAR